MVATKPVTVMCSLMFLFRQGEGWMPSRYKENRARAHTPVKTRRTCQKLRRIWSKPSNRARLALQELRELGANLGDLWNDDRIAITLVRVLGEEVLVVLLADPKLGRRCNFACPWSGSAVGRQILEPKVD